MKELNTYDKEMSNIRDGVNTIKEIEKAQKSIDKLTKPKKLGCKVFIGTSGDINPNQ